MFAVDPIATNGYVNIGQGGRSSETLVRIQQIQMEQVCIASNSWSEISAWLASACLLIILDAIHSGHGEDHSDVQWKRVR